MKHIRKAIKLLAADYLYHGTSLVQFEKMRANDFIVNDILYVGDTRENITDHYAEQQAEEDDSYAVTLVFDRSKLEDILKEDEHSYMDDDAVIQEGQFYFSGDMRPALVKVLMYNHDTDEETEIPL